MLQRAHQVLTDGRTYLRIVHLLLGAVLLLPYLAVVWVFAFSLGGSLDAMAAIPLAVLAIGAGVGVAVVPGVRALEITAARALLGVELDDPPPDSAHGWPARRRGAVWLLVNMLVGGLVMVLILWAVPTSLGALIAPWRSLPSMPTGAAAWWTVPYGLALVLGTLFALAAAGAGMARLAPRLLGPTPEERLAVALAASERRAVGLAERARLARELHDSVGHALTVSTLQAGAAAQVLDTDPAFVRRALEAIAETGRTALDDLDHVLGLLREDRDTARAPVRDLQALDALVTGARSAGVEVGLRMDGDPAALPAAVSREAYRLVQEGLTNALRHAGPVPVSVRITVEDGGIALVVDNPLPERAAARASGGRGLRGMAERAELLGGELTAGPDDGVWRLAARLPGVAV